MARQQQHESAHGKEFIDHPPMDPMKRDQSPVAANPKEYQEPGIEFPGEGADDLGQLWEERGEGYPFSEQLSDEAGAEGENAEQHGGSGPRIDDLGISDLRDKDEPDKADLSMLDEIGRTDLPVFDQSLNNRDPDQPDQVSRKGRNASKNPRRGVGKDKLSSEDLRPYDVSTDGPGTADLQ